jgi:hypothetical protein
MSSFEDYRKLKNKNAQMYPYTLCPFAVLVQEAMCCKFTTHPSEGRGIAGTWTILLMAHNKIFTTLVIF